MDVGEQSLWVSTGQGKTTFNVYCMCPQDQGKQRSMFPCVQRTRENNICHGVNSTKDEDLITKSKFRYAILPRSIFPFETIKYNVVFCGEIRLFELTLADWSTISNDVILIVRVKRLWSLPYNVYHVQSSAIKDALSDDKYVTGTNQYSFSSGQWSAIHM